MNSLVTISQNSLSPKQDTSPSKSTARELTRSEVISLRQDLRQAAVEGLLLVAKMPKKI